MPAHLHIGGEEELVVARVRRLPPPVLPHVEHPAADADPGQVAGQLAGDVGLAAGREAHHADDLRGRERNTAFRIKSVQNKHTTSP